MLRDLLGAIVTLTLLLNQPLGAGERKAEGMPLLTSQAPDGTLPGWKAFHEPPAKTGDVWTLKDGVLVCQV